MCVRERERESGRSEMEDGGNAQVLSNKHWHARTHTHMHIHTHMHTHTHTHLIELEPDLPVLVSFCCELGVDGGGGGRARVGGGGGGTERGMVVEGGCLLGFKL